MLPSDNNLWKQVEIFLEYLQIEKGSSAHTINAYKTDLRQFHKLAVSGILCPSKLTDWNKITSDIVIEFYSFIREQSYSALLDLDEDYEVGKISDKDYQMLRQELLHETAEILKRIENSSDESVEDEIQKYKERHQLEEQ